MGLNGANGSPKMGVLKRRQTREGGRGTIVGLMQSMERISLK